MFTLWSVSGPDLGFPLASARLPKRSAPDETDEAENAVREIRGPSISPRNSCVGAACRARIIYAGQSLIGPQVEILAQWHTQIRDAPETSRRVPDVRIAKVEAETAYFDLGHGEKSGAPKLVCRIHPF